MIEVIILKMITAVQIQHFVHLALIEGIFKNRVIVYAN